MSEDYYVVCRGPVKYKEDRDYKECSESQKVEELRMGIRIINRLYRSLWIAAGQLSDVSEGIDQLEICNDLLSKGREGNNDGAPPDAEES